MKALYPYLFFDDGKCRQAMEFYKECLGGELKLMTAADSPMAAQMPPAERNRIMHCTLVTEGISLMASDNFGTDRIAQGRNVSLCMTGSNRQEIGGWFAKLSKGGKMGTPLREEFFGTYGDFTDKFGVNWLFQAGGPQQ
jgi:PhnB protein